jgi:ribosomal protein L31E
MTKEGYKTVIIRKEIHELVSKQAQSEGVSIAEIVNKAVERYVHTRKDLEERIKLVIQTLDRLEKDFPS